MKTTDKKCVAALAAGSTLFLATSVMSMNAMAAPDDGAHLYLGGNYGVYKDRGGDFDEDDNFKEALVGVKLNPYLGLEASYLDFGDFSGDVGKAKVDGYDFAVVGTLPLTDSFDLYAKVGQLYWDADVSVAGIKRSYDGDEPFVGVGANFYITDNLAFVVEYDRYKVDLDDSDLPAPATRFEDDMDTFKIGGRLLF